MPLYVLVLNDMRSPQIEIGSEVAKATSREELIELIRRETVPSYNDGQWGKSFRQGGPLEWHNPPSNPGYEPDHFGHGIHRIPDKEELYERYMSNFSRIPDASTLC